MLSWPGLLILLPISFQLNNFLALFFKNEKKNQNT